MDYGEIMPWVRRRVIDGEEVITAVAGPDQLLLRGPRLPTPSGPRHTDEFDVSAGDELTFATTWFPSYAEDPELVDVGARIEATLDDEAEWISPAVPTCRTRTSYAVRC